MSRSTLACCATAGHRALLRQSDPGCCYPNPTDVAASLGHNLIPERELGKPAVHHVAVVTLQMEAKLLFFIRFAAINRVGHVHSHGHAAIDGKVGCETASRNASCRFYRASKPLGPRKTAF